MTRGKLKELRVLAERNAPSREEFSFANKLRSRFTILEEEQLETVARIVHIAAMSVRIANIKHMN